VEVRIARQVRLSAAVRDDKGTGRYATDAPEDDTRDRSAGNEGITRLRV
jgi:hypothetical protein